MLTQLRSKCGSYIYEGNIWLKTTTSYIWLLCKDTEIREKGCVLVISRLSSNKELAAEIVRAIKTESKVWLMFVEGEPQQTMYARRI